MQGQVARCYAETRFQKFVRLEVYKAFKEQITGNHRPLHYNIQAADAIAKFITDSIAAHTKGTAKDLRTYFNAVPRADVATGDLYDSP